MNCGFLWVQRLFFDEFMAFCKSVINHSLIMFSSNPSHQFQYVHYKDITVNSDPTLSMVSAGLRAQRWQECAAIGRFPQQQVGSLEGLQTSDGSAAINLLTKTLLCLCLCLFCRAFQSTLLASRSHINTTILLILQAAWGPTSTAIFTQCTCTVRETLLAGRWLFQNSSPTKELQITDVAFVCSAPQCLSCWGALEVILHTSWILGARNLSHQSLQRSTWKCCQMFFAQSDWSTLTAFAFTLNGSLRRSMQV